MNQYVEFPDDFQICVQFHGHVCPGLAIGYAAARAGARALNVSSAQDEEIVAIVENDSCAVDAVQVILGCTFGKGNLIFRDWGKQVLTVIDRRTGRAVRVSFRGELPGSEERFLLKNKIDAREATDAETWKFEGLRRDAVVKLVRADPAEYFDVREVEVEMPARAQIVNTRPCTECGEPAVISRLLERDGRLICKQCARETP